MMSSDNRYFQSIRCCGMMICVRNPGMEAERITKSIHPLFRPAMRLYRISFPFHEQREDASQLRIMNHEGYHFDVFTDNDQFVGEALYWEIGDYFYIEHLCVNPLLRNMHYGQEILRKLQIKPLILEIDPPADEISRRRRRFYERCGFVENTYAHVHPAYHPGYAGHNLTVMSFPERLPDDDYDSFNSYLKSVIMAGAYE